MTWQTPDTLPMDGMPVLLLTNRGAVEGSVQYAPGCSNPDSMEVPYHYPFNHITQEEIDWPDIRAWMPLPEVSARFDWERDDDSPL